MYAIGIDPGWSGGISALHKSGELVHFHKFTKRTETEIIEMVDLYVNAYPEAKVCLEKVWGRGGSAAQSSFRFGWHYGLVRARILGKLTMYDIPPKKWMSHLGCMTKGDKKVTQAMAQQLFPITKKKITQDDADAILIGEYCRQVKL